MAGALGWSGHGFAACRLRLQLTQVSQAVCRLLPATPAHQWEAVPNLDQFFTRVYRCAHGGPTAALLATLLLCVGTAAGRVGRHATGGCLHSGSDAFCTPHIPPTPLAPPTAPSHKQVLGRKGVCRHAHRPPAQPGGPGLHRCALLLTITLGVRCCTALPRAARTPAVAGAACWLTAPPSVSPSHTTPGHVALSCSADVGGAAAVRQLGRTTGRLPAPRHLRYLGGGWRVEGKGEGWGVGGVWRGTRVPALTLCCCVVYICLTATRLAGTDVMHGAALVPRRCRRCDTSPALPPR